MYGTRFAIHLLESKDAQKSLLTPIYCGFIEVFDHAFICSFHQIAYTYSARSSEVLPNSLLKKWDQSDTLTAVKDHVIKYSETTFSNSNVNYFW